jgi:hypothetical protein
MKAPPRFALVWITRFALTRGVYTARGRIEGTMVEVAQNGRPRHLYFHGLDWHLTREAAEARVAELKAAALTAAPAKLARLGAIPAFPEAGAWPGWPSPTPSPAR